MSMPPKVRRVLLPPAVTNQTLTQVSNQPAALIASAVRNVAASADLQRTLKSSGRTAISGDTSSHHYTLQRRLHVHPVLPLTAYVLEQMVVTVQQQQGLVSAVTAGVPVVPTQPKSTTKCSPLHRVITVQNWTTQQVVFSCSLQQLAAAVFPNAAGDPKKLISAVKSLGSIQSLQFYDPTVLYWSGMMNCSTSELNIHWTSNDRNPSAGGGTGNDEEGGGGGGGAEEKKPSAGGEHIMTGVCHGRWQALVVQTDKRILLLNTRQGPCSRGVASQPAPQLSLGKQPGIQDASAAGGGGGAGSAGALQPAYSLILANLHESTLQGAVPSSNVLALTDRWLLVGCADGSLKCYNWKTGTVMKSIKGLGKGDWIVQLLAANRYNTWSESSSVGSELSVQRRRILTVTKKGSCYLIELDISPTVLEIKPPLARFVGGASPGELPAALENQAHLVMEHDLVRYDAHNDLILWFHPGHGVGGNHKTPPTMFVWNLQILHADLLQQTGAKTLFKPDPNITILYPASVFARSQEPGGERGPPGSNATICSGLLHPSFGHDTVLTLTLTASGDVYVLGAVAHPNNTVSSCTAAPVLACNLAATLIRDANLEDEANLTVQNMGLRVHAIRTQPLSCSRACEVIVATNWGIVLLEIPPAVTANDVRPEVVLGAPQLHFGASLGSMGKSLLFMQRSSNVVYGSLDVLKQNPVGGLVAKNTVTVYESPPASHVPAELQQRPFRLAPVFLPSPSRTYVALFWPDEYRYEILHLPTLLQTVEKSRSVGSISSTEFRISAQRNPVVASGSGITGFGWIGDHDVYSVIHAQAVMQQAFAAGVMTVVSAKDVEAGGLGGALDLSKLADINIRKYTDLTDIRGTTMNIAGLGLGAVKGTVGLGVGAVKGTALVGMAVGKTATKVGLTATKTTLSATKTVTLTTAKGAVTGVKAATGITMAVGKTGVDATVGATKTIGKGVAKGVKQSLRVFGVKKSKKKKNKGEESGIVAEDGDDEEEDGSMMTDATAISQQAAMAVAALESGTSADLKPEAGEDDKRTFVEMFILHAGEASSAEIGGTAATSLSLGELQLRGGNNRNPPTVLFGGPCLCVGSRSEENPAGHAHFYTRKKDEDADDTKAELYVSSGPTIPYPDLVAWDDDGCLCAVVINSRVCIYLSSAPDFQLLGTVRITSPADPEAFVTSVRFISGVLYCCTYSSVHCVFLGNNYLQAVGTGGEICFLDTYTLASTVVPMLPPTGSLEAICSTYVSFAPPTVALPLVQPVVLGYQSGSLMVSTVRGIQAIPCSHPVLRIGILLASGQTERACKWFDAVPQTDHEALATFLERRGHPEFALQLPGLSLEGIVDISMRHGYASRLEEVVETYGAKGLRTIDMGRGVTSGGPFVAEREHYSVVVCVGAYLLAHGRVELARRLATECLRSGEEGRKDALVLASLLMAVDESDARRLIHRAVEENGGGNNNNNAGNNNTNNNNNNNNNNAIPLDKNWLIGNFVREHVLDRTS